MDANVALLLSAVALNVVLRALMLAESKRHFLTINEATRENVVFLASVIVFYTSTVFFPYICALFPPQLLTTLAITATFAVAHAVQEAAAVGAMDRQTSDLVFRQQKPFFCFPKK